VYASASGLEEAGVISGYDLTGEAAKLVCLIAKELLHGLSQTSTFLLLSCTHLPYDTV
jgi:hypothetical protein